MRIALDYDNTYSADPDLWNRFAMDASYRGHEVVIVTARDERFDVTAGIQELVNRGWTIYWCRGVAKKWYMHHFGDVDVDVWIDDKPESIMENSATPRDKLTEWRMEDRP